MTLGSLFDGIGGFPLAAAMHEIKTVWTSEIDPQCEAVTKSHFPDALQLGDITAINGAEIPPVDIISGGSPCQDLSVAGKRAGLEGKRSGLFMEMIRIIKEMRNATGGKYPAFVIWENVPGAFSSNKGEDFRAVVEEFCRCAEPDVSIARPARWQKSGAVVGNGYSFAWRVFDAQFWGVPQRRKRIYAVLHLGGERAPEILFEREGVPGNTEPRGTAGQGASGNADGGADGCTGVVCYPENQITSVCNQSNPQPGDPCPTLTAVGKMLLCMDGVQANVACDVNISDTLMDRNDHSLSCHAVDVRKRKYILRHLTPLECERLNGFPDLWTQVEWNGKPMSDTAIYRMVGNSIAVPCAVWIFWKIKEANREQEL